MVHAQFAQPGAAFARGPASVPAVAYGDERPVRLAGDEPFDAADDLELAFALAGVYGQINVYSVTTKSERYERSYWTRTAAGNGIGGRKAPVPYGS